jgi:O-antigen ligase
LTVIEATAIIRTEIVSATSIPADYAVPDGDRSAGVRLPVLDRITWLLLLACIATMQFSIAASQALLAATLLGWVALIVRDRERPAVPPFFLPLAVFAGTTLVSVAFSLDPAASLEASKKLVLLLIVPLVYHQARGERAWLVVGIVLTFGALSAAYGIFQYGILQYDNLGQRPHGSLGHYMTYSGQLMLVLCAAVARVVLGSRDRTWPALLIPALVAALAVTFTRSAWVGACVGVGLLFVLRDFRLLALLPVVVALFFALAPDRLADRLVSMFDLQDPTNRDRLAMLRTGTAMVADDPLTGVGPNMIRRVYEQYRDPAAVQELNIHLHNVPLQIAAELGLPALGAWLWFIGLLVVHLLRLVRTTQHVVLPATALAAVGAMLAAGMFEYNFGDSEFLMLLLVLVTLPFAALRGPSTREVEARP